MTPWNRIKWREGEIVDEIVSGPVPLSNLSLGRSQPLLVAVKDGRQFVAYWSSWDSHGGGWFRLVPLNKGGPQPAIRDVVAWRELEGLV